MDSVKLRKTLKGLVTIVFVSALVIFMLLFGWQIIMPTFGSYAAGSESYVAPGVYVFDSTVYSASEYSKTPGTVNYYNSTTATTTTSTAAYWANFTTSPTGVTGPAGTKLVAIASSFFSSGTLTETTQNTGFVDMKVLKTTGTARYSVSFGETGTYRVYFYNGSATAPSVKYSLIDSGVAQTTYSTFTTPTLNEVTADGVADGWWYVDIPVSSATWTATKLSITAQNPFEDGSCDDTDASNTWKSESATFDTVLALDFTNCSLGSISKLGQSLTIDFGTDGTLECVDAWGTALENGVATSIPYGPVAVTATPNDGKVYSGFNNGTSDIGLDDGYFYFNSSSGTSWTALWVDAEALAEFDVFINGSATPSTTMDFYSGNVKSSTFEYGIAKSYKFVVTFDDPTDIKSLSYAINDTEKTGTLSNGDALSVDVQWNESQVVVFTATTETTTYTATYTINKLLTRSDVAVIGDTKYKFIEDAIMAATSGQTIELIGNTSFWDYETAKPEWKTNNAGYTIDSGVNFVIPYAYGQTTLESSSADSPYANQNLVLDEWLTIVSPTKMLYLTLTIPEDITLNINSGGVVAIGGTTGGNIYTAGATIASGYHSNVQLDGKIAVNSGGVFSTRGYVLGSGEIVASGSGAKIYQPMIINDYVGGMYTVSAAGNNYAMSMQSGEKYISPFIRWSMVNIRTKITVYSGAYMYGYACLNARDENYCTTPCIVGDSSAVGLISLNSGSTFEAVYDTTGGSIDNVQPTRVTVDGGGYLGELKLHIEMTVMGVGVKEDVYTSNFVFPLSYNYDVTLQNGTYKMENSFGILPGAYLRVASDAVLNIGDGTNSMIFAVYNGIDDRRNMYSPYPTAQSLINAGYTPTGNFIVDGTLNINSGVNFGGIIQTTSDSATVVVNSGATMSCSVQVALVGSHTVLSVMTGDYVGATVYHLTGRVVDNATGALVPILPGLTYKSFNDVDRCLLSSFTFDLHNVNATPETFTVTTSTFGSSEGVWLDGSWYNYTTPINTVDYYGETLSTDTLYFCYGADLSTLKLFEDKLCDTILSVTSATSANAEKDWNGSEVGAGLVYYLHGEHLNVTVVTVEGTTLKFTCTKCAAECDGSYTSDSVVTAIANGVLIDGIKYYMILTSDTNVYLLENITPAEGSASFAGEFATTCLDGGQIQFVRDNGKGDLLLRGYQTNGTGIRFFASLSPELMEKYAGYDGIKITMSITDESGTVRTLSTVITTIYEYLYNTDSGTYKFMDSYVFSVKTDLAFFVNAGNSAIGLTLTYELVNKDDSGEYQVVTSPSGVASSYDMTINFADGAISSVVADAPSSGADQGEIAVEDTSTAQ